MVIVMVTTTVALILAGIGIVAFDAFLFRRYLARDLSVLARIIADNSTAAIEFNDPRVATETLSALRARTHMISACLYRLDGAVFARYSRAGADGVCPPIRGAGEQPGKDRFEFGSGALAVSRPVLLHGRSIGTIVLLYDLDEVAERITVYSSTVLGVLCVSIVIAFLLSAQLRALIATPISQLVTATTAVSDTGDYSVRVRKDSGDELGVLVDTFNVMLASIQSRDQNLTTALREKEDALREAEKSHERFHFMAESMPQKIFTATQTGEVDYFNRQWLEFTGLPFTQIRGWGWTQFVHPDDIEANLTAWRSSIRTGEPFNFQHRFRRADGVYRWHLSRVHAMRDGQGNISMWIGSNTEIHEQKEKEAELRRANEDLQQFAYSASHDLQEPIRNVAVYSEIIARRYRRVLDEEGLQFLGFLTEGGRRLATLVNDLLAYTRAGAVDDLSQIRLVASSEVLHHSLSSLAEAIRESQAVITFDPLPGVYMGESHLQQLFQNLIGNALKYRREIAPRIHISAIRDGASWRFSIQDNGIGIDDVYKEKIFGVFKRLHRDQRYSGTGIGLAICQRVAERYGGRIWVESEPGRGSTFFFTVPDRLPEPKPPGPESPAG
jgi:PAS domain S-box-containing protein